MYFSDSGNVCLCVHSVMSAIMWGEYMCWQCVCLKRGVSVTLPALSLLSVVGCTGEINGSCPWKWNLLNLLGKLHDSNQSIQIVAIHQVRHAAFYMSNVSPQ